MNTFGLTVSDAAVADILDQEDWYASQVGPNLSKRWERAVANALIRLTKNPRIGTICRFKALELRHVRRASISGFPKHLIFYSIENDRIVILRVLHGARDLETLF